VNRDLSSNQQEELIFYSHFLNEVEMEDVNVLGRRFTWYHPNGRSMSRIDRVLISKEWRMLWGDSSLWVLPRDVSDHCPLVLKDSGWDWEPRPFWFNNYWLENREFKGVVEEAWRGGDSVGWMSFVLKEKLKCLKRKLKDWHKGIYGDMENKVDMLVEEIRDCDVRGEAGQLSDMELQPKKLNLGSCGDFLRRRKLTSFNGLDLSG